jgi:hypothetical protein
MDNAILNTFPSASLMVKEGDKTVEYTITVYPNSISVHDRSCYMSLCVPTETWNVLVKAVATLSHDIPTRKEYLTYGRTA